MAVGKKEKTNNVNFYYNMNQLDPYDPLTTYLLLTCPKGNIQHCCEKKKKQLVWLIGNIL